MKRKAILQLKAVADPQFRAMLHSVSPYMLTAANKTFLEFYISTCSDLGATELLIIDENYDAATAEFIGDDGKWPVEITYVGGRMNSSLAALTRQNSEFLGEYESLLVLNGLFFNHFDMREIRLDTLLETAVKIDGGDHLGDGLFFARNGELYRLDLNSRFIDSPKAYFDCNMRILEREMDYYVLPGYRIEQQIHTGMNVEIPPRCEIEPPAVIGDQVRFSGGDRLTGKVCIGNNVVVDRSTKLQNTVVLSNSYIGEELEIVNKIILGNRIIDPESGDMIALEDDMLLADVKHLGWSKLNQRIADSLGALPLLIWMTPLFVLFRLGNMRPSRREQGRGVRGRSYEYPIYPCDKRLKRDVYFHKFSLDKYPLLFLVLRGDLRLTGESLPHRRTRAENFDEEKDGNPEPGVFCFSDAGGERPNDFQLALDDSYFRHNRSFSLSLTIIAKTLTKRLFSNPGDCGNV